MVVPVLLRRVAADLGVAVDLHVESSSGGKPVVFRTLRRAAREASRGGSGPGGLVVAVVDANCQGYREARRQVEEAAGILQDRLVCAIPDPHVERWLLLDSEAFARILGRGCRAPDQKCDKDRYFGLLIREIHAAGVVPVQAGLEYAEAILTAMNLTRAEGQDPSLRNFLRDLKSQLKRWSPR